MAAVGFFKKLQMAQEINFKKGSIKLFGHRMCLCPIDFLANYILDINDSSKGTVELYEKIKPSLRDSFPIPLGKEFSFTFNDFYKWLTDIVNFAGFGVFSWGELNQEQ